MEDFGFYFRLGWQHIISWDALDHLLFILVLSALYEITNWKQVLILVTAFTIGHSITLALSVLDVFRMPPKLVEFLIPCTIVVTGVSNLFKHEFSRRSVRRNYYLALFFGLIHGMGFANTIRFMLAKDQQIAVGLFSFNAGLEVGQIAVVLIILTIAYFFITNLRVNRREWVIFLSAAAIGLALEMAAERIV